MNPPLPRNLTHDPEPEPNAKPVLKSQESSAQTMKPLSPRNPNPPDLDTTEAVISQSSAKILPRVRYYFVLEYFWLRLIVSDIFGICSCPFDLLLVYGCLGGRLSRKE